MGVPRGPPTDEFLFLTAYRWCFKDRPNMPIRIGIKPCEIASVLFIAGFAVNHFLCEFPTPTREFALDGEFYHFGGLSSVRVGVDR